MTESNNGGAGSPASPLLITRRFTATDLAGNSASATQTITVIDNTAPTVNCPTLAPASAGPSCQAAIPNVVSSVTASDNCTPAGSLTITQSPAAGRLVGLGAHTITVTVTDAAGNSSQCSATFTVVDNTPPSITGASANPSVLWPPNHHMVDVTVNYNSSDNCGSVSCSLSVTSNEPINGTGDGDTAPDWEVVDAHHVRLRAERAGTGSGRIYTITITCTDSAGNRSSRSVTLTVHHNQ